MFTTFGEMCACRHRTVFLSRIVHGFRSEGGDPGGIAPRREGRPSGPTGKGRLATATGKLANGRFDEQQAVLSRHTSTPAGSAGRTRRSTSSTARSRTLESIGLGRRQEPARDLERRRAAPADLAQPRRATPDDARAAARAARAMQPRGARAAPPPRPRHEPALSRRRPPYQAMARDIDRVRGQEEGAASFGKIAGELKGLRDELRQQMTAGLRREFEALRSDIERAYAAAAARRRRRTSAPSSSACLGRHPALAERSDDRSVNMLRLELEQVKSAIETLAREESVQSVDRRWDDFDRRWSTISRTASRPMRASRRASDPAIGALTARLEEISEAVNNLPESLSLRSLEDKVRTLAGASTISPAQQDGAGARDVRPDRGAARRDLARDRRIDRRRASRPVRPGAVRAHRGAHLLAGAPDRGTGRRPALGRGHRPPQRAVASASTARSRRRARPLRMRAAEKIDNGAARRHRCDHRRSKIDRARRRDGPRARSRVASSAFRDLERPA